MVVVVPELAPLVLRIILRISCPAIQLSLLQAVPLAQLMVLPMVMLAFSQFLTPTSECLAHKVSWIAVVTLS
jgi:hypothetical protein